MTLRQLEKRIAETQTELDKNPHNVFLIMRLVNLQEALNKRIGWPLYPEDR
jgi:hypothetical protein